MTNVPGAPVLLLCATVAAAQSQPPIRILNPTSPDLPSEARLAQFDFEVTGASWRVFGVDSLPDGPVGITQVAEVKQHNPPSSWAVHVKSRALMPIASFTVEAAVVDVNGNVKAVQKLPAIKNLKPGQEQRRETRVRVTVIAPTDRVVFYVKDVISETGNLRAAERDVAALIKAAAARLPVP
jgi:hypothetical protein